jgi:hypothetical protein
MARRRRIHLQHLIGQGVLDSAGQRVGHIEEIRATNSNDGCYVEEYLLGQRGLALRLSIPHFANVLIRRLGAQNQPISHRVPWQKMNISDPRHPRLRCTTQELDAMQRGSQM